MDRTIQPEEAQLGYFHSYQRDSKKIGTARDHVDTLTRRGGKAEFFKRQARKRPFSLKKALGEPSGTPVVAVINANRWVAHCECMGAEVVDPEDPVFFCLGCHNILNDGKPRPVIFPTPDERVEIEEILLERKILNRHWIPTESPLDLARENVAHRLAIPDRVARRLRS